MPQALSGLSDIELEPDDFPDWEPRAAPYDTAAVDLTAAAAASDHRERIGLR